MTDFACPHCESTTADGGVFTGIATCRVVVGAEGVEDSHDYQWYGDALFTCQNCGGVHSCRELSVHYQSQEENS